MIFKFNHHKLSKHLNDFKINQSAKLSQHEDTHHRVTPQSF